MNRGSVRYGPADRRVASDQWEPRTLIEDIVGFFGMDLEPIAECPGGEGQTS